jgi:aryl carrier-like protein
MIETPSRPLADWLGAAIATLARLPAPPASTADLRALGLTSLAMVALQYRLMTEQDLTVPLGDLAAAPNLAALAERLETLRQPEDAT